MYKPTILILALILFSCQTKRNDKSLNQGNQISKSTVIKPTDTIHYDAHLVLDNFLTDVNPAEKEITIINENCGVFVSPDSIQIARMKGKTDEEKENFYIAADDNSFYQYKTHNYLDSMHVKCLFPKTRYLKFLSEERTLIFDTKSNFSSGWMVILFSPDKLPRIIDFVSYKESYTNFFNKK
jgi:hypothetical protein